MNEEHWINQDDNPDPALRIANDILAARKHLEAYALMFVFGLGMDVQGIINLIAQRAFSLWLVLPGILFMVIALLARHILINEIRSLETSLARTRALRSPSSLPEGNPKGGVDSPPLPSG